MPNETNWQDITRRLDISKASVTDTCNKKERAKGRAIKKIPYIFTVPATSFNMSITNLKQKGLLLAQYNYTAPASFKLLRVDSFSSDDLVLNPPAICIRYRIGTTVYRYRLPYSNSAVEAILLSSGRVQCPVYINQLIKANFTVEFWTGHIAGIAGQQFSVPAFTVETNLLMLPDNSDSLYDSFGTSESLTRADLSIAMPETLPVDYGASSTWLTN